MKNRIILCLVAAGMAAVGCNQKEMSPAFPEGGRTVTVRAVSDQLIDASKVLADDSGTFTWEAGDAIGVWTGSELTKFVLDDDSAGKAEGTFVGTVPAGGAVDENSYAVYPYDFVTVEGTSVKLDVKSSLEARQAPTRLVPMFAKAGAGHTTGFAFKHLGAVAKFTVKKIPDEIASIYLEASSGNLLFAKGGSTADLTATDPQLSGGAEGYSIAVPSGSRENVDIYVPVVPGTYADNLKLSVKMFENAASSEVEKYTQTGNLGSKSTTYARGQLLSIPDMSILPKKLYIYFWAWSDVANAQEMTRVSDGVFSWSGHFIPWQFKFLTSTSDYWTGYFRDPEAADYWTMKETDQETMFMLNDQSMAAGWYTITADLNTMKVTLVPSIPDRLFIYFWYWEQGVGAPNARAMTKVSDGVFTWSGDCNGAFKFLTNNGASSDYDTGYSRDASASDYWTMIASASSSDVFNLGDKGMARGWYTVTANLNTMTVSVEKTIPDRLYVYAFEWDPYYLNASPMTSLGDGKFTWSGLLPRWEFKFGTEKVFGDDYWTGYFRDPDATDYWTLKESQDQQMFQLNDVGYRDGWVTLNVDLNTLKVEAIPHIWLIGSAFSWGWDRDAAEEMTLLDDGNFSWTGWIWAKDPYDSDSMFKFLVVKEGDWYGYWRNSTDDNYWVAGENWEWNGAQDQQFQIAHDNLPSGDYTIHLNIQTKVVTVTPAS